VAEPFGGTYRGARVFVTGHTGFKGSWLALWLAKLGASVAGYALDPPTTPSLFQTLHLDDRIGHLVGDVRDEGALQRALVAHEPEVVFHLAAQSLVRPSYNDPVGTYATNVMGTVNVLEAVRHAPSVRAVVVVTSDKCYADTGRDTAHREDDPMGGRDPYSSSKGCAELVTAAYRESFFGVGSCVRVASVRGGNVIGGGDWAVDRIIPDCVRALGQGKPIQVRNPGSVRPWQHVHELLAGYLWLGARLLHGDQTLDGAWNFGPMSMGTETVLDLVRMFVRAWGDGEWRLSTHAPRGESQPHEARYLALDCAKAETLLGWHAIRKVSEAVRDTAAWYRAYHYGSDMIAGSEHEIDAYILAARAAGIEWASGRVRAGCP